MFLFQKVPLSNQVKQKLFFFTSSAFPISNMTLGKWFQKGSNIVQDFQRLSQLNIRLLDDRNSTLHSSLNITCHPIASLQCRPSKRLIQHMQPITAPRYRVSATFGNRDQSLWHATHHDTRTTFLSPVFFLSTLFCMHETFHSEYLMVLLIGSGA